MAVAFGTGMINVDMIVFRGKDNGVINDLWSSGYYNPTIDDSDDLMNKAVTLNNGKYDMKVFRNFDTGDGARDRLLESATSYTFAWAASTTSADLGAHERPNGGYGRFQF